MARAVVLLVALLLLFLTATCADSSGSENLKRKQPDADDYATKLRAAVLEGNFYNVERALEKGADVNGASTTGVTPLMIAAYKGEEHIIRFLLEKGADIDKQDYRGQTALIVASHKGDPDIVRVLLDGDPNLDLRTKGGWWSSGETALEVAERSGHLRSWATGVPSKSALARLFDAARARRGPAPPPPPYNPLAQWPLLGDWLQRLAAHTGYDERKLLTIFASFVIVVVPWLFEIWRRLRK